MRITFFGHADFSESDAIRERLVKLLRERASGVDVEFLFGGYGGFDRFAYGVAKDFIGCSSSKLVFVTPYITESYLKNQVEPSYLKYDCVIYPEIEKVPYKFAIGARNKWMVNNCDLIIFYVARSYGGAYTALLYARARGKESVNLVDEI